MLANKIAVVTGGGRGIGRGITDALLAQGAKVFIAQRQPLDEGLSANPNVGWCSADLSDVKAPKIIAEKVLETFGEVDILVNNAGIMYERSVADIDPEEWSKMVDINMRAPLFLVQALLPQMRHKGGGAIINTGSIEGLGANPNHTAYCATKAGIHGMTQALAVDLGQYGIRCNAVAPGWIDSDLSQAYINSQADPERVRQDLLKMHPAGRLGRPDDIGATVAFLASDAAAFITGQVIAIDGGRTAKLPLPFD